MFDCKDIAFQFYNVLYKNSILYKIYIIYYLGGAAFEICYCMPY